MRRIFIGLLPLFAASQAHSQQRLPAEIIPSGIYTFLWAGVDTNANQITRSGLMPATLPGLGRVKRGTLEVKPGHPQSFVMSWVKSSFGAPDSTLTLSGSLTVGKINGPLVSADDVFILNSIPAGPGPGLIHRTNGKYYLLPGMNIRIALSPPSP